MTQAQQMVQTNPSSAAVDASALVKCIEACGVCAEKCERHASEMGMEHCRVCAELCRRCEQACNNVLSELAA